MTLLVEDDLLQREILEELLSNNGYEVLECVTAEAAELVVATSGPELQAVVTDHNLQGSMTGAELARFGKEKFPDVRCSDVGEAGATVALCRSVFTKAF